MSLRNARATAKACISGETTLQFDMALHGAARSSVESMAVLQRAVCDCVTALKARNVSPVDMILAMKACALDSSGRYHPEFNPVPASNVDILIDVIVKWSIAEYYRTTS